MPKGWHKRLVALASSALLLGAIFWILQRQQALVDLGEIWRGSDKRAIMLAIAVMMVAHLAGAARLKVIAGAVDLHRIAFLSLFRIQLISQFAAHGAPVSALGDLARAAMLKLRFAVSLGRAVRIVFYERLSGALGAVALGLCAVAAELCLPAPRPLVEPQLLLWGCGLAGTAALLLVGNFHLNTRYERFNQVVRAVTLLGQMLRSPTIVAKLLLISLLQMVAMAGVFIVLAAGMHIALSPTQALLFMPLIFFVSSLPIFYLGWGAREAVVIASFGSAAVSAPEAVALSVGFGVVVFLSSLPGALLWLLRPSMRKAIKAAGAGLDLAQPERA